MFLDKFICISSGWVGKVMDSGMVAFAVMRGVREATLIIAGKLRLSEQASSEGHGAIVAVCGVCGSIRVLIFTVPGG